MPVAAVLPELLAVLAVAFLLVLLLVSVQLYQNGGQARSFALNLPVVASPVVSAIDWLLGYLLQAARVVDGAIEGVLVGSAQALGNLVVAVVNVAGAAIFALIHALAATVSADHAALGTLQSSTIPSLRAGIAAVESALAAEVGLVPRLIAAAIAAALVPINTELQALGATERALSAVVSTYRPLWDSLAAVPGGAARGIILSEQAIAALQAQVGILERDLGQTQSGVSALERTVAAQQATIIRLSTLLTLAGAGTLALDVLLRLARDPCYCLTQGAFSDLPMRVEALEAFGP